MNRREVVASFVGMLAAPSVRATPAESGANTGAETQIDALLRSTGGRDEWAAAKGYQVWAKHYLTAETSEFPNTILFDFAAPRVRIESSQQNLWRARILDGAQGWRVTQNDLRPLTAEEVADDRSFWTSNVYRTLHRLATRDADVSAQVIEGDRLLILDRGKPLLWYRQNKRGEPIAFGPGTASDGTIFGPLIAFGPLKFPSFSVRDGGRWRAIIDRFQVNPDLSDQTLRRGVTQG